MRVLPINEHCLRVKSINVEDSNSVITNYYQAKEYTYHEYAIIELIMVRELYFILFFFMGNSNCGP